MIVSARRTSKHLHLLLVAAASTTMHSAAVGTATAQSKAATYPPEVEAQCTDDYFRHCSTYELGSDALRRCMEAKGRNLSPNCQQALKDAGYVKTSRSKR
ncbi:MAG: hypothetical protein SFW09_17145 [Hyphomicrobiaceae bacterium]|nr:hypothetical protein [Hyphomicrobiaceae bacterium]